MPGSVTPSRTPLRIGPLLLMVEGAWPGIEGDLGPWLLDAPFAPAVHPPHAMDLCLSATVDPRFRARAPDATGTFGTRSWRFERPPWWVAEGDGIRRVRVTLDGMGPAFRRYSLRSFLRFLVSETLLRLGGIALHAAAIARPQGAVVLMADSGGGKTTAASRFGGNDVLADDFCLVLPVGRGFRVAPSPFPGREQTPALGSETPLWRLGEIRKGDVPAFVPWNRPDAVAAILRHAIVTTQDREVRRRLLDVAVRLATAVPCGSLAVSLEEAPWASLGEGR